MGIGTRRIHSTVERDERRRGMLGHEVWPVGWEGSRSAALCRTYAHPPYISTPAVNQARQPIHTSRSLPSDRPVARGRRIIKESAAPALIGCTHQHQLNRSGGPGGRQGPTVWFPFFLPLGEGRGQGEVFFRRPKMRPGTI